MNHPVYDKETGYFGLQLSKGGRQRQAAALLFVGEDMSPGRVVLNINGGVRLIGKHDVNCRQPDKIIVTQYT